MSELPQKRLYLRLTDPAEIGADFLRMFLNIDGKNEFFRQSGREFTSEELIHFCRRGLAEGNVFYYSVCAISDKHVLGCIRIGPIDFKNSVSDMVALIGDTADRGRGLGTEAIRLGNAVAFDKHNIRKLSGGVMAPNVGSLKAYTRAGWVQEGFMRGHLLHRGQPVDWISISCFNPDWRGHAAIDPYFLKTAPEPTVPEVVQIEPSAPPALS